MSSTPVLLIFGSGANTGLATVRKFAKEGYKVAAVSRNPSAELKSLASLVVPADLSDPTSIDTVFAQTIKELGHPHVVIYNAYDAYFVPLDNPLVVPTAAFSSILNVNTVSAYAAARLAVKSFAQLPASASRAFMYTGNMQNTLLYPTTHTLGVGKNASAYFLEMASHAYRGKGYKFYYVDERTEGGESVMGDIDGVAHGEEFWMLANKGEQGAWCWTFVKGKGYVRNKQVVDREVRDFSIPGIPEDGMSSAEAYKMFAAMRAQQEGK